MGKNKVSLITTVLNEESSIEHFLSSIAIQKQKPNEVIVVDAGSTDKTVEIAESFKPLIKKLVILIRQGANRSVGRNAGIKIAKHDLIAISDAGCVLDKNWLSEITKPFVNKRTDVVAGYYHPDSRSVFEKCVAPYVLVMPDRVNPKTFLPATRSMAIKKSVWKRAGGFPKEFSDNEDYVFSHQLLNVKAEIVFSPNAIVHWRPRKNLKEFWIMLYRFARGDAKAGLRRIKIASVFFRYVTFILLGLSCLLFNMLFGYFIFVIFLYLFWSICKNYKYVKDLRAIFLLPILQVTSDFAVILGSIVGGLGSG